VGSSGISRNQYRGIAEAHNMLVSELEKFNVQNASITFNAETERDPITRKWSIHAEDDEWPPEDTRVAVRLRRRGVDYDLATDLFLHTADNLRSLALAIESMRRLERHGGGLIMARAMSAFAAIAPPPRKRPWWEILGVDQDAAADEISAAFRKKAKSAHPDRNGSHAKMSELNAARDEAMRDAR
jgi:hypothetical protein